MHSRFLIVVVLLSSLYGRGQNPHWDSLGVGFPDPQGQLRFLYTDTVSNILYTGNMSSTMIDGFPIYGVAAWDGSSWDSLGCGFESTTGNTPWFSNCAVRYNGLMHFGGGFERAGNKPIKYIATWNGTQWDSLTSSPNAFIYDMIVYHGKLYICGNFTAIGGNTSFKHVARWTGTTWENVGDILQFTGGGAPNLYTMGVYNDELYIGGTFSDSTNSPINIIRWDDSNWKYVGAGIQEGGIAMVNDLAVYNNELWIGGWFSSAATSTSNYLTRWNGSQFKSIGGYGFDGPVRSLHVYNNKLYAGGTFYTVSNLPVTSIALFDGQQWCSTGSDLTNSAILCMATYNDSLIIGGGLSPIDAVNFNHISMWTGGNYVDSCKDANIGIEENFVSGQQKISVYPNPNNGSFNLSFTNFCNNAVIRLLNSIGQSVYQTSVKNVSAGNVIGVSVNNLAPGMYLVAVETEEGLLTSKILVK